MYIHKYIFLYVHVYIYNKTYLFIYTCTHIYRERVYPGDYTVSTSQPPADYQQTWDTSVTIKSSSGQNRQTQIPQDAGPSDIGVFYHKASGVLPDTLGGGPSWSQSIFLLGN